MTILYMFQAALYCESCGTAAGDGLCRVPHNGNAPNGLNDRGD